MRILFELGKGGSLRISYCSLNAESQALGTFTALPITWTTLSSNLAKFSRMLNKASKINATNFKNSLHEKSNKICYEKMLLNFLFICPSKCTPSSRFCLELHTTPIFSFLKRLHFKQITKKTLLTTCFESIKMIHFRSK